MGIFNDFMISHGIIVSCSLISVYKGALVVQTQWQVIKLSQMNCHTVNLEPLGPFGVWGHFAQPLHPSSYLGVQ